jgi:hypothetical protein
MFFSRELGQFSDNPAIRGKEAKKQPALSPTQSRLYLEPPTRFERVTCSLRNERGGLLSLTVPNQAQREYRFTCFAPGLGWAWLGTVLGQNSDNFPELVHFPPQSVWRFFFGRLRQPPRQNFHEPRERSGLLQLGRPREGQAIFFWLLATPERRL